jgi:hypothetical protein
VAGEGFHETGEYTSFVEVRDHLHFSSLPVEIVRTGCVQGRDGQRSYRYGCWVYDRGDARQVPEFLPTPGPATVLEGPELQDLGQVRGDWPAQSAQLLSERDWIYQYLRRRGPRRNVQEIEGFFQQGAPGRDVSPAV